MKKTSFLALLGKNFPEKLSGLSVKGGGVPPHWNRCKVLQFLRTINLCEDWKEQNYANTSASAHSFTIAGVSIFAKSKSKSKQENQANAFASPPSVLLCHHCHRHNHHQRNCQSWGLFKISHNSKIMQIHLRLQYQTPHHQNHPHPPHYRQ